jgi:branched-chain amino acid transport system permease protein
MKMPDLRRWLTPRGIATLVAVLLGVVLVVIMLVNADQTQALILGLGAGSLIAAIALSITLNFQGSGVVNFSAGAMAMYGGYIYYGLRTNGKLFLPPIPNPLALVQGIVHLAGAKSFSLPNIPTQITISGAGSVHEAYGTIIRSAAMPVWEALFFALLECAVLGLLFHLLIFRPLRKAPVLARVVASVGLFIILQAIVVLRFGSNAQSVQAILPQHPVSLPRGIRLPSDQIALVGIVVVVTVLLWAVFKFTRFGLATRAAAENEKGAMVLGYSPDFLAGVNWVASTVLAGLFGILVAPINQSIDPYTITLLIVPALAAALMARFNSFFVTLFAGLGIGMLSAWIQLISNKSWFPKAGGAALPGLSDALPFVIIIVVLVLRGRSLPTRGSTETVELPYAPKVKRALPGTLGMTLVTAVLLFVVTPDWRLAIVNALVGAVICLSLVVLTGYVGQISLMQMALAGMSGFTLSKIADAYHVPFPFGPLLGAIVAVGVGLLASIPALRVRGVNLAVVTFAAAVTIQTVVFGNPAWSGLKGANVGPPEIFGIRFGPNQAWTKLFGGGKGLLPNPWFGVFCVIVVALLIMGVVNIRRSRVGRHMLAVRSNERAASAAGVSVARTKILAFALAAFIAGIGGALSGYRFGSVTSDYFGAVPSMLFLAFAYLGGISSVSGAVVGGLIVQGAISSMVITSVLHISDQYTLLLAGVGLISMAIFNPQGVAGGLRELVANTKRRFDAPKNEAATEPTPEVVAS